MSDENLFLRMALNNAWANATLYGAVSSLDQDAVWAERPGFFGSIGRTLNHIYEVDLYYVDALKEEGVGRAVFQREDLQDMQDLGQAQSGVDMALAMFTQTMTGENLAREVATERKGETVTERTDHLFLHLIQHQVHHRGQVHVMLSHAGIEPPQLDDFYLKYGRAPGAEAYWT